MSAQAPGPLLHFLRLLGAFVRREVALVANYRLWFLMRAVTFVFTVVSLVFLSRFIGAAANPHLQIYGGSYLAFGIVGLLLTELQHVGVSAMADRVRAAQVAGTLEAQLATPAPTWMVVAVAPVYELGAAVVRAAVYLAGAVLVLGVRFPSANVGGALLAALLSLLAFGGLGLLAASVTMMARRSNPVAALLGAASLLLSGVVYPTSVLPPWLQTCGELLPLTHALEALRRTLLSGAGLGQVGHALLMLLLFAVVLVPLGLGTFVYALRRARIDGSLSQY